MNSSARALSTGALAGILMVGLSAGSVELSPSDAGVRLDLPPRGLWRPDLPPPLSPPEIVGGIGVGEAAPAFDLPVISGAGERVKLEELQGRENVLLVVWAVWCPPCLEEFKELKRLHARYGGRGLRILATGVRFNQSMDEAREFARDQQVPFTVLYDEDEKVVQRYGVSYIPSNYLIDRTGVVRFAANGLPSDFDSYVEAVLADPQSPSAVASEASASR